MKKLIAVLGLLAVAGIAQAYVWNIDWAITAAFSPEDTSGSYDPELLADYSVTWSLINGTTGDTIASMNAPAGSEWITYDDSANGGSQMRFDTSLIPDAGTTFLGSVADDNKYSVYQYIFIENATTGDAYFWQSSAQDITPVAEATSAPNPIDKNTIIQASDWQKASTSVPEPATMSLLGLGALAMVLRRKVRK